LGAPHFADFEIAADEIAAIEIGRRAKGRRFKSPPRIPPHDDFAASFKAVL